MTEVLNGQYHINPARTAAKVASEIEKGLRLIKKIDNKIVTIFGAHLLKPESAYYQHAKQTAFELGKRGYAIITGGGPGVMHAANAGAMEAGAPSIGLKAGLLEGEQVFDPIYTHQMKFHFLFARNFVMSIKSHAFVVYPGNDGTLKELFEQTVLIGTRIVKTVPIVCVDAEYWRGLVEWLQNSHQRPDFYPSEAKDHTLLKFAGTTREIVEIVEGK